MNFSSCNRFNAALLTLVACHLLSPYGCRGTGLRTDKLTRFSAPTPSFEYQCESSESPTLLTRSATINQDYLKVVEPASSTEENIDDRLIARDAHLAASAAQIVAYVPPEQANHVLPESLDAPLLVASEDPSEVPAQPRSLNLLITGVRANQGPVKIALFTEAKSFPERESATTTMSVDANHPTVETTIPFMKRFAVAIYQDLNSDGQLNRNRYGIPMEPYAFSNNVKGTRGPPSFSQAVVEVKTDSKPIAIDLQTHR